MDETGTDTNALMVKIEEAKKKRTGLIDLYTSGDIDKSDFTALRAKYDEEIESVKGAMEASKKAEASECAISEASLPISLGILHILFFDK